MGKEQNAEYYDSIYNKSESYKNHWTKSHYVPLWDRVLSHLNLNKPILDLGCGPGQFGQMCGDKGCKDYFGIDFSKEAIKEAKEKNTFSNVNYHNGDLFKIGYHLNDETQIIICETLEHIDNDLTLLESIKATNKGKKFVFTIPTFDDPAHVRYYKTANEWKERYNSILNIEIVEQIGAWILITGTF